MKIKRPGSPDNGTAVPLGATPNGKQVDPDVEVWWGPNGIDALIWADAEPYVFPPAEPPTYYQSRVLVGDAR